MATEQTIDQYICQLTPRRDGFSPESMTPQEAAAAKRHYDYLKAATDRRQVILAGSALDEIRFGIVIFEAESEEAGRGFMEGDPFVAAGVMRASLHPFRVGLARSAD